MGKSGEPSRKAWVLVGGVVGLLVGIGLLAWGLLPVRGLVDTVGPVFGGGQPPDDLGERMDAAMARLKARVWADGVGFVLLLAGFVAVKAGLAKPGPSVEQLVQAEVARRLAMQAPGAASPSATATASAAVAVAPAPVATPAATPAVTPAVAPAQVPVLLAPPTAPIGARRTHCATCSSVLVAGGRICPMGHPQA